MNPDQNLEQNPGQDPGRAPGQSPEPAPEQSSSQTPPQPPVSAPTQAPQQYAPAPGPAAAADAATGENPDRNYLIALLLSFLLGTLGIDRFYLGKTGTAILKLITGGGLGIWAIVDLLLIAFGRLKANGDNRPLEGFAKNYSWVKPISIILIVINAIVFALFFVLVILSTVFGVQEKARQEDNSNGNSVYVGN